MTDIRMKGFGTRAELDRYMAELDEEAPAEDPSDDDFEVIDLGDAKREIAWLRKEVADLRAKLQNIRQQTENVPEAPHEDIHPWLRIAATVATTFVLGKLVRRLRLGAPGAAAVPMIAAQLDRRIW
ncbi:hypothetical protein [Neorhizobium alkalisoli]|uniref:Uncharacterized protein n=1 Tax=Neorhizobium alkalisoli TaxID=528178 RepID=A0A561PYY2_9HYPH|nr:hypothetical protein [Neorhizobium alkalisoli]TWF43336.1 hypothetical protein FHW37_1216 [Neorhizobium alkalisoli]